MNYKISFLEDKDYDEFCKWWSFWRFPAPPKEALPGNGTGGIKVSYINEFKEEIDVCAGFLYSTNSSLCWLEFVVSNPRVRDKKVRQECLSLLIEDICLKAKENGYGAVFSSLKNENLINKYKEVGFLSSNSKTTELTLNLNNWK